MKKFVNWFQSFFDEDNGASTTRALTWLWTLTLCGILWVLVIARVVYSFKNKDASLLVGFPAIVSSILMLTTAYLAAKVVQKGWGEQDSGSSTTTLTLPSGSFVSTYTSQPVYPPQNAVSGSLLVNGSNP